MQSMKPNPLSGFAASPKGDDGLDCGAALAGRHDAGLCLSLAQGAVESV